MLSSLLLVLRTCFVCSWGISRTTSPPNPYHILTYSHLQKEIWRFFHARVDCFIWNNPDPIHHYGLHWVHFCYILRSVCLVHLLTSVFTFLYIFCVLGDFCYDPINIILSFLDGDAESSFRYFVSCNSDSNPFDDYAGLITDALDDLTVDCSYFSTHSLTNSHALHHFLTYSFY